MLKHTHYVSHLWGKTAQLTGATIVFVRSSAWPILTIVWRQQRHVSCKPCVRYLKGRVSSDFYPLHMLPNTLAELMCTYIIHLSYYYATRGSSITWMDKVNLIWYPLALLLLRCTFLFLECCVWGLLLIFYGHSWTVFMTNTLHEGNKQSNYKAAGS